MNAPARSRASDALDAAPGRRQRAVRIVELAIGLVGFPAVLLWGGGVPTRPDLPTVGELGRSLNDPSAMVGDVALRPLFWLGWLLWLYLFVAVALSAIGHLGGPKGALRIRNRLVPRQLCHAIDVVFLVTAVMGPKAAAPSATAFPSVPVAASTPVAMTSQQVAPPAVSYVVRPGDSLSAIAAQNCGSSSAWPGVFERNRGQVVGPAGQRLRDPDVIRPGWSLALPDDCGPPVAAPDPDVHVVRDGESLWAIAEQAFGDGRRWVDIYELNKGRVVSDAGEVLDRSRFLKSGWQLRMPSTPAPVRSSSASPPGPHTQTVPPPAAATPGTSPAAAVPDPAAAASSVPGRGAADQLGHAAQQPPRAALTPPASSRTRDANDRGGSSGIALPGGSVVPWTLGAAALAVLARARTQRLRRLRSGTSLRTMQEPSLAAAVRQAGIPPSADALGPLAERVLQAWTAANGTQPRIEAVWGRRDLGAPGSDRIVASFLLDAEAPRRLPATTKLAGVTVRFEREGDSVWAVASAAELPSIRRGIYAFADGLLTSVGTRQDGALHLPLLGPPMAVSGPGAERLVEAMILTAALRSPEGGLRVLVAGELDLLQAGLPLGGADLPKVERVAAEDAAALRQALAGELLANATAMATNGVADFCEHALVFPSDRLATTLVIVSASEVADWAPLFEQGAGRGLGAVVVGEWPAAPRRLEPSEDGRLAVHLPGREGLGGLVPGCLPTGALAELVESTRDDVPAHATPPVHEGLKLAHVADEADPTEGEREELGELGEAELADGSLDQAAIEARDTDRTTAGDSLELEPEGSRPEHTPTAAGGPLVERVEAANGHERPGPPLRLRLFGTLRLERPDGTEIPQPKGGGKGYGIMAGREVLSYLALHRGWVDSETLRRRILGPGEVRSLEQQQASINNGMSNVRTWAQGGLAAELRASLSATELRGFAIDRDPRRGYRLNSEHVWVDVRDFEDAMAEARRSEHPEPALRRALELYTGDLLTNYGRPGNSQREPFIFRDAIGVYLRGDACLAADRLAAILQDKGRPEEALQMVTPLLDGAVCELLERRAMAIEGEASPRGLGDRTRVHKRWQRLRDRLTSELGAGTEPEPATLGTYGQIMRSSAA